jgi:hypothetical protein
MQTIDSSKDSLTDHAIFDQAESSTITSPRVLFPATKEKDKRISEHNSSQVPFS